ncbi:MAG: Unknown protein [uncultured Sulfurovum sp.]|uniref:YtkA-like domain-containing protein n=1 Tax=uncultured Sulfurovum sp. TaxID=269237 RepID=A0A6S6T1I2_9BACT|nr:MAG: Unknown protein [uncultured Sulfurovum sp.]
MTKKNQNRFWFLFVMAILTFGIGMVIWTVKQAMSVPVHESNNYMLKYQMADMNINKIMELQAKFNAKYNIELQSTSFINLEVGLQNTNAKRAQKKPIKLTKGPNSFKYLVSQKDGKIIEDAKVSFLLTRPHSRVDDTLEELVSFNNNYYTTKSLNLSKKGRYTLQVKVQIGELIGYSEISAYLID